MFFGLSYKKFNKDRVKAKNIVNIAVQFNLFLIFPGYTAIKIKKKQKKEKEKCNMIKKYMAAAMVSITILGMLTGCGLGGGRDIGKEEALDVALADAGVKEEDTTRLRVSTDRDDGRKIYEIQFDVNGKEYDYEIDARDGDIVSVDTETIQTIPYNKEGGSAEGTSDQAGSEGQSGQTDNAGGSGENGNAGNGGNAGQASGSYSANVDISQEQAIQIALERVSGATEADVRIELDYDDGKYKYEGDIIHEQREYEFEIDANTGTILEWSEERR